MNVDHSPRADHATWVELEDAFVATLVREPADLWQARPNPPVPTAVPFEIRKLDWTPWFLVGFPDNGRGHGLPVLSKHKRAGWCGTRHWDPSLYIGTEPVHWHRRDSHFGLDPTIRHRRVANTH